MLSLALALPISPLGFDDPASPCVADVLELPRGVEPTNSGFGAYNSGGFAIDAEEDRAMGSALRRTAEADDVVVFWESIQTPSPSVQVVIPPGPSTGSLNRLVGDRAVVVANHGILDRYQRTDSEWEHADRVTLPIWFSGADSLAFDGTRFAVSGPDFDSGYPTYSTVVYSWDEAIPATVIRGGGLVDLEGDLLLIHSVAGIGQVGVSAYRDSGNGFTYDSEIDLVVGTRALGTIGTGEIYLPKDQSIAVYSSTPKDDWAIKQLLPLPFSAFSVLTLRVQGDSLMVGGNQGSGYGANELAVFEHRAAGWELRAEVMAGNGFLTRAGLVTDIPVPLSIRRFGDCPFQVTRADDISAKSIYGKVATFVHGAGIANAQAVAMGDIPLAWNAVDFNTIKVEVNENLIGEPGSGFPLSVFGGSEVQTIDVLVKAPNAHLGTVFTCPTGCQQLIGLSEPGDDFAFLFSFSDEPTALPGGLKLSIGAAGRELFVLDVLPVGSDCFASLPVSVPQLTQLVYAQGVALSPSGSARSSNVLEFGPGSI